VFQSAGAANLSAPNLSAPSLTASLILHFAGILFLCLASFPVSRPGLGDRRLLAQVTLTAPSLKNPARPVSAFDLPPKPAAKLVLPHRRFEAASPQVPELLPKLALDLPPVLDPDHAPLPKLPRVAEPLPTPPALVKAAGFVSAGSGAAEIGPRRRMAMGGFEAAPAATTPAPRGPVTLASGFAPERPTPAAISTRPATHAAAGFGDASVAPPSARRVMASASAAIISAEILDKPRPSYTDEARRLNIEGEVVLDVTFQASGEAKVLRVMRGLGHGLDESAIAAARLIHFRPAQRDGVAIDSPAVVHILFQLAY
jgi:TonB family protein